MPTINITDYNNNKIIRQGRLEYKGQGVTADKLYSTKFRIQTQTFPVYIPLIISPNNIEPLTIKNVIDKTDYDYRNNGFITSFALCVHDVNLNNYSVQPVIWSPQKNIKNKPINIPSRYETVSNNYFYAYNSIHILVLIQTCIDKCLSDIGISTGFIKIAKVGSSYQLFMTAADTQNIKIYFNYDLCQAFNFYYKTDYLYSINGVDETYNEIIFDKNALTDLIDTTYLVSQVLGLSSRIFPFSEINFHINGLGVEQIITSSNSDSVTVVDPVIFSYDLNVTDVDNIVDNFNFSASSISLPSTIMNHSNSSFTVTARFRTFDGLTVDVLLNKYDNMKITLVAI